MPLIFYILVISLGLLSYLIGILQTLKGNYKPSLFSRLIWLLLAINSYAGVILSEGSAGSIVLVTVILMGNIGMSLVSMFKGSREFGTIEIICTVLLIISAIIWLVFSAPLVNLSIALFASFIGGLPVYKRIWVDPKSEDIWFWCLFFLASVFSLIGSFELSLDKIIVPVYYILFDGSLVILCLRRFKKSKQAGKANS